MLARHEKGILRDHQLALHKMQQYKQRKMSATVKGDGGMDQLEHRIVQQEDAIHTMENRNLFSLYCLQMETQFIHKNMNLLVQMLQNLVDIEVRKHTEVVFWLVLRPFFPLLSYTLFYVISLFIQEIVGIFERNVLHEDFHL